MSAKETQRSGQDLLGGRVQAIAHAWDILDTRLVNLGSFDGIRLRGIRLNWRGSSWLIVISAEVNDERFVMFREASSSGDIGKVIQGMLESPDWKKDKFADK